MAYQQQSLRERDSPILRWTQGVFSDTVEGANASASPLVETAKANGIDPYRYLTWLFRHLPLARTVDDYEALLPWKMPLDLR